MVTRSIKCIVVEVPVQQEALSLVAPRGAELPPVIEERLRPSARDLLPWADPYIAGLIRKLQDEVRAEREAEQAKAALVRQEMSGDKPLWQMLVDEENQPLAHQPFELEEFEGPLEGPHRPHQPR